MQLFSKAKERSSRRALTCDTTVRDITLLGEFNSLTSVLWTVEPNYRQGVLFVKMLLHYLH